MLVSDYVELHAHSAYSFLDGASRPVELVERSLELGYRALALTDHDGLYGSMEFAQSAGTLGVQPITGAEVTLESPWPDEVGARYHVTVLAETPAGYANLCRLLTRAHMDHPRDDPRLSLETLLGNPDGLVLLTGCRRSLLLAALERGTAEAEAIAGRLRNVFGPRNLFVELQHNSVHGDRARIRALRAGRPTGYPGRGHGQRPLPRSTSSPIAGRAGRDPESHDGGRRPRTQTSELVLSPRLAA